MAAIQIHVSGLRYEALKGKNKVDQNHLIVVALRECISQILETLDNNDSIQTLKGFLVTALVFEFTRTNRAKPGPQFGEAILMV